MTICYCHIHGERMSECGNREGQRADDRSLKIQTFSCSSPPKIISRRKYCRSTHGHRSSPVSHRLRVFQVGSPDHLENNMTEPSLIEIRRQFEIPTTPLIAQSCRTCTSQRLAINPCQLAPTDDSTAPQSCLTPPSVLLRAPSRDPSVRHFSTRRYDSFPRALDPSQAWRANS